MFIVWGSGNYGRCDEIPGLCHVVTRFGHLYYVPLIPTTSLAVISQDSDGMRGAEIPVSMKSVLLAWARAALLVGMVVAIIITLMAFTDVRDTTWKWISLACTVGVAGMLAGTYRLRFLNVASRERAIEIAQGLGLDEEGMQMIDEMYTAMETPDTSDDFVYEPGFVAEDPRFRDFDN